MEASKQYTNNYQEHKRFISRTYSTKGEFLRQYSKIYSDKEKAKQLYFQILSELKNTLVEGAVESFKRISNLLNYISDSANHLELVPYYDDDDNPFKGTNLVILACEYDNLEILKYVFKNVITILNNLHRKTTILPTDEDESKHTAFYYAIHSGNIELLKTLSDKWPGNYFTTYSEKLDDLLSTAYEELKLKNVLLSKDIEIFIEDKLINLRFFSNDSKKVENYKVSLDNIKVRIEIVLENINSLTKIEDTGDKFLFIAKFIAQNISVLKQQLKSTYDRLPWEEIEFCLVSFISSYVKKQEINLFYQTTLSRSKILKHLINFAQKLEKERSNIESFNVNKLSILPKISRDNNVIQIISNNPQFKELYDDYQEIRDIHSLEKISSYVKLASSADPREKEGQLIIVRSLQVIGEYLKNTLESPKLSTFTSELLLLSLPSNTRKIFINLRNSLSHVCSVTRRLDIQENNVNYFAGIQNDSRKIGREVNDLLYKNKIKTIKMILKKIINSEDVTELKEIAILFNTFKLDSLDFIDNVDSVDSVDSENLNLLEYEKLENLIEELSNSMIDKIDREAEILSRIRDLLSFEKSKLKKIETNYSLGAAMLCSLCSNLLDNNDDKNDIKLMKYYADVTLENLASKIEPYCLKEIAELSLEILRINELKIKCDYLAEIKRSIYQIIHIAKFEVDNIKWIEKLKERLNRNSFTVEDRENKIYSISEENCTDQLTSKLSELKNILNKNASNNTLKLLPCKSNEKLQAVLEMLILDILSILGSSRNYLENNLLFLDESTPLLIGKCLRNHLAHDNTLVDVILSDPSVTVILNAKKLSMENLTKNKRKIGRPVREDPARFKNRYKQCLTCIINQEKMFAALEAGNLEDLMSCIAEGADIYGRNIDLWTSLHFAAKGSNPEVVKFLLDHELDVNAKNSNNQRPLHIAAASGNKSIVQLLLKENATRIDDQDSKGKTALHYAAQNGHKDTVNILLKYKADFNISDSSGFSPLHCAVKYNHKDIVVTLISKEVNADINEAMGGFTPLHIAADRGHVDLVNYLLKLKANVFAETDRGVIPLHLAAVKGHLEVVKILILKGSDVKAKGKDGGTPLHNAVEYGYREITEVLLKHGADVNAADNIYHYTPLHYAAKDGYDEIVNILLKNGAEANAATTTGITPLHFAIKNGHMKTVAALVKYDDSIFTENNAFLHIAAEYGHKDIAEFLINCKIDIDAKNNNSTPLHIAAFKGNKDIVSLLIKHKVKINVKDINGSTPLHAAADNGNKDIADMLIRHKADVNAKTNNNVTPMHIAAMHGNYEIVKLLIENNGNVNITDSNGFKPLHIAAQYGHEDIIELLIKNKADVNAIDHAGITALHAAVETGFKEAVKVLIANGAAINTRNRCNHIPLCTAIKCNNKEMVEILIASGADINVVDSQPLLFAVLSGNKDIVKVLLQNKAQIDIKYTEDVTLLHIAVMKDYKDVVSLLVKGIDINCTNINNATPLHFAAKEGFGEIVELLIENGANVCAEMSEGVTPIHIAAIQGHVNVLNILLRCGVDSNVKDNENRTPLELSIVSGHFECAKILMERSNIDINTKGINGLTLLHWAAQAGNLENVKLLLNNGADINAKDVFGSKPIHVAARDGHTNLVEFFIDQGLSVNELGRDNQTLLHYAALSGQTKVAKYLIEQGADVNGKDCNEATAMHMAAISCYKDFVELLLDKGAIYNTVDMLNRRPVEVTEEKSIINLLTATEKLHKAVKQNNFLEVQICLRAGAFINAKSMDNVTPLHHAAWKGYENIVDILLQNNGNPNVIGKQGLTPLHYAAKFSHLKIAKALLANGAIYNAVSEAGKTPADIAEDKSIISLFKSVNEAFKNIESGHSKVFSDLKKIKDVETVKAIMGTINTENKTLITLALHNNFPGVDQLKQILQDDLSDHIKLAEKMIVLEKYEEAIQIFRKVLEKRKEILGVNNPGTLDIQGRIATLLYKQYKYQEALSLLEEVYQKQRDILGENDKTTLNTKSTIALVLHRQGYSEEAFKIYEEVYPRQREARGITDSDLLNTRLHMAVVLEGLHKYDEALNIFSEILEKQKKQLGLHHQITLSTQNNIAAILDHQGKYDEALKVYRKVYEVRRKYLGATHSDTFKASHNMIAVLVHQKKYSEALEAYEELYETQMTVLGPDNIYTLTTRQSIAQVLLSQGKCISALKIFNECFPLRKAILGSNHPDILYTQQVIEKINLLLQLDGSKEFIIQNPEKEIKNAIRKGDVDLVQNLLNNIPNINDKDDDGRTLLHFAVDHGHIDIVNILLKNGAIATKLTNRGNTPLHTATSKGYKEIVEVLLKHVSRDKLNDFINAKTYSIGTTSLHVAAKNGYYEIVKTLLKHGAIYEVRNKEGKAPIHLSTDQNIIDLLKLIDEVFEDVKLGNAEIIDKLEVIKPDDFTVIINTRDNQNKSIIQVALVNKHQQLASKLLKMLKTPN